MNQAEWIKIRRVFEETIEQPEASRDQFLELACCGDDILKEEVVRLLRHHSEQSKFLETPPSLVLDLRAGVADVVFHIGELVAGRFRIIRPIASGGMGEVYEAADQLLNDSRLALKTVRAAMAWDERIRARFRTEVELARKVTHPSVCRIHQLDVHRFDDASGSPAEVLVLTMELLHGRTLADYIGDTGPIKETAALPLALDVIDAMAAAHRANVLHGDLKPNNIMLIDENPRLRAVVTDFGLAQGLAAGDPGEAAKLSLGAGAPAYLAPEVLAGGALTSVADMYALGVVLFEMLAGVRPFPNVRTFEDAIENAGGSPPTLRKHLPAAGNRWEHLVNACLQPDPARRCPSPEAAREILQPTTGLNRREVLFGGILLLTAAAGAGWTFANSYINAREAAVTIAVLPFENGSGEAEAQYAVDGLTDEIREALARIPGVRTLARHSSTEVAAASVSYASAGQRLGAKYVVAGVVRRSTQRLRATVRLTEVSTGIEIWRRDFDKPVQDSPSARIEISAALAAQLKLRLAPQTSAAIMQGGTTDPVAFDAFLRARRLLSMRETKDLEDAKNLFGQALQADPRFALAWTGQAESLEILAGRENHPFRESMTEARNAVRRALELAPDLPEALLEMGMIRQRFEWDWKAAETAFRQAVESNPNSVEAHRLYAGFLSNLGRSDLALSEIESARVLDPLSLRIRHLHAVILLRARRYAEAVSEFEVLLHDNPDFQNLYAYTGDAYLYSGQWAKGLEVHQEAIRRFGAQSQFLYNLAYALAQNGQVREASQIAAELERRWPAETFVPTYLAKVYIALKEDDKVFYWLEKAFSEKDSSLMVLNVEPWYDPYRADPRFRDLIRRVGLNL